MKKRRHIIQIFCCALLTSAWILLNSASAQLSPNARFSVLTCSPGPDLYSLFGHSAFRLVDTIGFRPVDVVFNYGTFDAFDNSFYTKFALGKLDYKLQVEYFDGFIESYAMEGRGVWEQELLLNSLQRQRLFSLLQSNVEEENCVYRYDFFYDNCSSRIRDMTIRAVAQEPTDSFGFRYVSLKKLLEVNEVKFSQPCAQGTTYREAIQTYLNYQPWSDFGIDIALGRPCDDVIGTYGFMFLPDSLMRELEYASINGSPLCGAPVELLPNQSALTVNGWLTPLVVVLLWLVLHTWIVYRNRAAKVTLLPADGVLLGVTSLVSLLVVFLWFFTDHTATQGNWNLLWANPVNVILLFFYRNRSVIRIIAWVNLLACSFMVISFPWLPQSLHIATIPIALMLIITAVRLYRNARIIEK